MTQEMESNNATKTPDSVAYAEDKRCLNRQFFNMLILVIISAISMFVLFNMLPKISNKGEFQVISVFSYQQDDSIAINADLKMDFPDVVVDALENGIPLTIAVEVQVYRERPWWRNIIIKQSTQLFELRYHPLTDVHEVKNIATDERYSFDSRQDAMAVLGTIRGAHLIKNTKLNDQYQYYVQMRLSLDVSYLPPALRQVASLSSDWRLESAWFRWKISRDKNSTVNKSDSDIALKQIDPQAHFNLNKSVKPVTNIQAPGASTD